MVVVTDVAEEDADLTAFELAEPPTPLSLDPDRGASFLGKGGGVKDEHRVRAPDCIGDLADQLVGYTLT